MGTKGLSTTKTGQKMGSDSIFWPTRIQKIKSDPTFSTHFFGGGKRDRTADLLHAMQALSQLSYTPIGFIGAHDYSGPSAAVRRRSWTTDRGNSASTASSEGVCARPQTTTRTAGASWPIFRPC